MNNFDFTVKKIIRFVYLQPEISVSIEKLIAKFGKLTRDDLNTIIQEMAKNNWIELAPTSNLTLTTVGSINDDASVIRVTNNDSVSVIQPTHVSLTLIGKDKALEQNALILQARKELILKPIINTLISGIIGFVLGYLIHLMQ